MNTATTATATATTALVTGWDRLAVIVLGAAGCALSASALMQMATAIHIRPTLTYLFPLVIDGFIAYGIRALLVLRTAPLRARLYVWTLVGTATGVSVWANALHAVRLNQTATANRGLQLGDTVVAALSTVAPLALAGAVHLYILIARATDSHADRSDNTASGHPGRGGRAEVSATSSGGQVGQPDPAGAVTVADRPSHGQVDRVGQSGAGQPVTALTGVPRATGNPQTPATRSLSGGADLTESTGAVKGYARTGQPADLGGHPDDALPVNDRLAPTGPVTTSQVTDRPAADRPVTRGPDGGGEPRRTSDRRSDPDTEQLLEIARSAVKAQDKLTRQVVARAIRGQKIPLSSDTLTALMAQLREQRDTPVTVSRD